jgi:hypothetical protein
MTTATCHRWHQKAETALLSRVRRQRVRMVNAFVRLVDRKTASGRACDISHAQFRPHRCCGCRSSFLGNGQREQNYAAAGFAFRLASFSSIAERMNLKYVRSIRRRLVPV